VTYNVNGLIVHKRNIYNIRTGTVYTATVSKVQTMGNGINKFTAE